MRVSNLPLIPFCGECLYCEECGAEYSAHAGDYFLRDPQEILTCGGCETPLVFVRTVKQHRRVSR